MSACKHEWGPWMVAPIDTGDASIIMRYCLVCDTGEFGAIENQDEEISEVD